jgi:hypothetical protein
MTYRTRHRGSRQGLVEYALLAVLVAAAVLAMSALGVSARQRPGRCEPSTAGYLLALRGH